MQEDRSPNGTRTQDGHRALVALLVVQALLGYEWLASGLTKLVHGDFPGGLAGELTERSKDASGWYRSFLDWISGYTLSPPGMVARISPLCLARSYRPCRALSTVALWTFVLQS